MHIALQQRYTRDVLYALLVLSSIIVHGYSTLQCNESQACGCRANGGPDNAWLLWRKLNKTYETIKSAEGVLLHVMGIEKGIYKVKLCLKFVSAYQLRKARRRGNC